MGGDGGDLNGSPLGDRGRRRVRTKTATQRDHMTGMSSGLEAHPAGQGGEVDEGGGFSDVLADAILKRPESMRDGSFRSLKNAKRGGEIGTGTTVGKAEVSLNDDVDMGAKKVTGTEASTNIGPVEPDEGDS